MSISSSVGLISGMDIGSLVTQLMAIESRPLNLLKTKISTVQSEQAAYSTLSANLLAAVTAVRRLSQSASFGVRTATSSNENVLTATVRESTAIGTYSFQVRSLASTHKLVSAGFTDRDRTPLGTGTLTLKNSKARVDNSTRLAMLNGGQGVRRGVIRITDRTGGVADVDLTAAVTIDDVLQAINSQSTADVSASIDGDRIVLTDQTGATTGILQVQDMGGGGIAADLGIAGSSTAGELSGSDLLQLSASTRLSLLNDGIGVRVAGSGDDIKFRTSDGREFSVNLSGNLMPSTKLAELNDGRGVRLPGTIRITNRYGQSKDISLDGLETIGDVMAKINTEGDSLDISASLVSSKLLITDGSGGQLTNLKIEDVTGNAAADLGIVADVSANSITSGTLYRMDNVGAVLRAIQYADGNDGALTAAVSADGNGIVLTDTTGEDGITVEALNGSMAARDLGLLAGSTSSGGTLTSRALLSGLNTVLLSSLNGGSGVNTGVVEFTRRDNTTASIDFTGAQTLRDVLDRINAVGGLSATIDSGGMGIVIKDTTTGTGTLAAHDLMGTTAADLHLTASAADRLASGDLNRQYISENTLLADLYEGKGIQYGSFSITTSDGKTSTVSLTASLHKTVGDVMKTINGLNLDVEARINANGDGIELVDTSVGAGRLTVAQISNATTAKDLGILGQSQVGSTVITGSFAQRITIDGGDTLDKLVQKINDADAGVTASVINDGSSFAPYRLILSSTTSGSKGQIAYATGTTGLSLSDMTVARDAVVSMSDGNSANPVVVASSSNTVTGLVDGLTLNLTGTSTQLVNVTVNEDIESILTDMQTFVDAFNATMDTMDELTKYVPDTEEKGVLLGDHTVQSIHDMLYNAVIRTVNASGLSAKSLSQIGIDVGNGARLSIDEEEFRAAFEKDPEGMEKLFTLVTKDSNGKSVSQGLAVKLRDVLDSITNSSTGVIAVQNKSLQDQVDMFNERATEMQELLDQKEDRLYKQFQTMEETLAKLQTQQSALSALSTLASSSSYTTA